MVRVKAESSLPHLQVCAFVGSENRRTVVLLNRETVPVDVAVPGSPSEFAFREDASPYHENRVTVLDSTAPHVRIPPGSVVTLSTVNLLQLPVAFAADGP